MRQLPLRPHWVVGLSGLLLAIGGFASFMVEHVATSPAGPPPEHCWDLDTSSTDPLLNAPFCAYGQARVLDWSRVRCVDNLCTIPSSTLAFFMETLSVATSGVCVLPQIVRCEHDVPGLILQSTLGPPERSLLTALGLRVGDIVRTIDGQPARNLRDGMNGLERLRSQPVVLGIQRGEERFSRVLIAGHWRSLSVP